MKIGVAQIRPLKGDIFANMARHKELIALAASENVNGLFFPELSLTGYEPKLANKLAVSSDDSRLELFQEWSDFYAITLGVGIPTMSNSGIRISMVLFQPGQERMLYSKQILHEDEFPYFEKGNHQVILEIEGIKVAPAICYESMQLSHAEKAHSLGGEIYVASVAKSLSGIIKAYEHFPKIARNFNMPVLMANSIGLCDDFESAGKSTIWTKQGILAGHLDYNQEGVLVYDTICEEVMIKAIPIPEFEGDPPKI